MTPLVATARPPVEITLRAAGWDDREAIWAWNNAPEVRAVSKDARPIPLADHLRWYAARLAAGRATWIVMAGGAAVGVVRFDRLSDAPADPRGRISIALAAAARGLGAGRRAIALACAAWRAPVIAEIAPTNLASRAAFAAAGFTLTDQRDDLVTYQWTPPSETPVETP